MNTHDVLYPVFTAATPPHWLSLCLQVLQSERMGKPPPLKNKSKAKKEDYLVGH